MSYYAAGSPNGYRGLGSAAATALIPTIQQALKLPIAPNVRGLLSSALAAASTGNEASARDLYANAAWHSRTFGVSLPALPSKSGATSTTGAVAKTITDAANALAKALTPKETAALPSAIKPGGVTPHGRAPLAHERRELYPPGVWGDIQTAMNRQYGPLRAWQWGLAAGGVVIAASVITKVAKYALIGGAVAGGAILAGKAGGVIR